MTIDDMLDKIEGMREALSKLDESEPDAVKFALVHQTRMLGELLRKGDIPASRRKPARSAYRMGCAALGIEEAA